MRIISNAIYGRRVVGALSAALLSVAAFAAQAQSTTNIEVSSTVQQPSVTRLGVNLSDQSYWDSGQILKNLVFRNPGFEGLKYRSILKCTSPTANTCMDDNQYSGQPTGFWKGGTYLILSGASAGTTGTVVQSTKNPNSCSGCGQIVQFDQNVNAAFGDYFVVTNYFPGNGDAGWWDTVSGGGSISTELNDISPNSPGKQALVLNASGSGQSAGVTQYFDTYSSRSFIQLNGTFQITFRAKGVGGNNQLNVTAMRLQPGIGPWLSQTMTLTNSWQDYSLTFTANETGSGKGNIELAFQAHGANVELDDVSLQQTNSSASNPTVFRDDVVNTLKELNPGTIRMMAAGAALGSDVVNQLAVPLARYRGGFNSGGTTQEDVAYGIHEFLQLCQTVNADPWITIPTATTPEEMTALIQYMTGNGSDSFSASRIARGQAQPWTTVFNKIHIELGNETWNGDFKGESIAYPAYPLWGNQVFGAARAVSSYEASKFDLVLDGWAAVPGYNAIMLSYSTQHDSMDMAPYLLYSANDEPQATMFGALMAQPEMFESPGGEVYNNMLAAQNASRPTRLSVYETNMGSTLGSITQSQLDLLTPSIGAGIATTEHMLQMMRLGVYEQNAFALPQYQFKRPDSSLARLWGLVVDMGTTNRRRPQFQTQALANTVIGGNMLQTVHSGSNPTWNQPLSSDGVKFNGAHYLQSFAFNNNGTISVVLFNLSQDTALPVTFSGANAPSGSVQMTQLTSGNITDNNETTAVIQPASQTLSGFNPSTPFSLPPFSMTVLTSNSTTTQTPGFSVPGGSYGSAQTVTIAVGTPGAKIFYTTDGSTPSPSSTQYTAPVTVSSNETLSAMATATGLTNSGVATAAYVIGSQQPAATPGFSVAAGSYSTAQTVAISDGTSGASIYYTTNGATPTTGSTPYSGPITVSATETLKAIATAPNYSASGVASASYTITSTTPQTAMPVFTTTSGSFATSSSIAISDATAGATIYYTTDGSTPTTKSTVYSSPVPVDAAETLQAVASAPNHTLSAVASSGYTIGSTTAAKAPVFSVAPGSYATTQQVAISDATPGATIYYTTNGMAPTTASAVYRGPISITASQTLQAIAVAPKYTTSGVARAAYVISSGTSQQTAPPIFSIAPGTYDNTVTLTLSDATPKARIYYSTNGSVTYANITRYTGPITISSTTTVLALGITDNMLNSVVSKGSFVITAKPSEPTVPPIFSIRPGIYTDSVTVTLTTSTAGASIYYTLNGQTPTTSSTLYTMPITVKSSVTIQAIAVAPKHTVSTAVAGAYQIVAAPKGSPVFSVAPGTYYSPQWVSIYPSVAGSTIHYTTDGTAPGALSSKYSGPIQVSAPETIKAVSVAANQTLSPVAVASYTIVRPAETPTFSVRPGTYTASQSVSINATRGFTIYYTTNGTAPTTSSTVYTGPIAVSGPETIKAMATNPPYYAPSAVAVGGYDILLPTATPRFSVPSGSYSKTQYVSIYDATPGYAVYYTTDGTAPTIDSTRYTGPIAVSSPETIKAMAIAANHTASSLILASYNVTTTLSASR